MSMLGRIFGAGGRQPRPSELATICASALRVLGDSDAQSTKAVEKAIEEVTKTVDIMKNILYGEAEGDAELRDTLAHEILATDGLLGLFISQMNKMAFEAKKDVAQIFNNLLRRSNASNRNHAREHICENPAILDNLMDGYEGSETALNCGLMLRECIRHESLASILLHSPKFYAFFDYVEVANFDVASDAFATFKDLLTSHKQLAAEFLDSNYDEVFGRYQKLLSSKNYVTRRQSLKLLGELLLDRANFNIMTRYISNSANMKLMMNLLREPSKSIQFEAFHVFKVFVANPNKPKPVMDILLKNKDRLVGFLEQFQNDRDDEQFKEEKQYLIKQIQCLSA
eukprot:TRINITY_DN18329_c0_g1_i1.p1 TRINITY_DN18329_c0_g1~~TRINITY_DN18329_c0_g1_i1.p1  ORF type:complete len:341 (-),score=116.50 TRINITY_DN18329_c0_g1_i1:191-1213(-)